jgi:acyl carrier protein
MQPIEDVLERARRAMAAELGLPPEQIRDDTDLVRDLGLDSLDQLRVLSAMEDEFGVNIPDDAVPTDRRFRAIVEALVAAADG